MRIQMLNIQMLNIQMLNIQMRIQMQLHLLTSLDSSHLINEFSQLFLALEGAQSRGIGAGDIDDKVVSQLPKLPHSRDVVGGRILRLLVLPKVDPHDPWC